MLRVRGGRMTSQTMNSPSHASLHPTGSAPSSLIQCEINLSLLSCVPSHTGHLNWGRKLNGSNTPALLNGLGHSPDDTEARGKGGVGNSCPKLSLSG